MTLTQRHQNSNVGDYWYTISITLSSNGCCSVNDAERIAVVISAMMNTSGGVLQIQIDTGNMVPGSCESTIKEFDSQLLRIITTQGNWIPRQSFLSCVKACVKDISKNLSFFINKASDLVTHHTYAYIPEADEVRLITDHDIVCRMLRECSCKGEERCQNHLYPEPELESILKGTDHLSMDTSFAPAHGSQYFCRYYKLHDRSLIEVLCTQSVRNDIKELISALANSDGGSIFLGVTNTDTPVVKGYTLDVQQLSECLSQLIDGQGGNDIAVWSTVKSVHENWKQFIHPVSGCDVDKYVIEIRLRKCQGGMFCSMPQCLELSDSGDIRPIIHFEEWKDKMLRTYKLESGKTIGTWEDHFSEAVGAEANLPSDIGRLEEQKNSSRWQTAIEERDSETSEVFQWWLGHNQDVTGESLRFDHCCARELADNAIDIQKPFSFFPSQQTVVEQYENVPGIHAALMEIAHVYRNDNGAGVIIQNICDHLGGDLKGILPRHHTCDIIILKTKSRPSVISVLSNDCNKEGATLYNTSLTCLIKRLCLVTYSYSKCLSIQGQVYCIGSGFESVEEREVNYPEEYL